MSAIEVRIQSKQFGDDRGPVLQDLALHAEQGEFLCLVGPSGAGKSTLLNIIAGLDRDYRGSICLNGRTLHETDSPPATRIGFVFQEPRLMPWLSVLENLLLVTETGDTAREHVLGLLQAVELSGVENAYPNQLSGGMQRRVALARAFAVQPEILLMDEPFVSLDAPTADRLRAKLVGLWQRDKPTIVFVTHNLREALALADRVAFLSPRPARVVKELPLDLPRPRHLEDPGVSGLRKRLLSDHPELLAGSEAERVEAIQRWGTA